jgi:asparagine synthetase B (glutamine-hydrolysing)
MPGIVGVFSDKAILEESEKVFSIMTRYLSSLGPLIDFKCDLQNSTVHIGLLTDDPCFTKNYDDFQLLAFSQTTKDEANQDLIIEGLKNLKTSEDISEIPQMLIAVGVTDTELRVARSLDGLRPLYYSQVKDSLVFSSEKKAIWALVSKEPQSLEPGSVLRVSEEGIGTTSVHTRTRPPTQNETSQEDHIAALSKLLRVSFSRIRDREKYGILFSGGVDSSLAAMLTKEVSPDCLLITVAAQESKDFEKTEVDASKLSLEHELVLLDEDTVWEILPEVIYAIESYNRMDVEIAIPFFLASRKAHALGCQIVVSGQGPDELFAGYARYERAYLEKGTQDVADELWADFSVTHEKNIARDTKAIEYHGVRSFFPYLDIKFTEAAFAVPVEHLIEPGSSPSRKILFRTMAKNMGLDGEIANTQKHATQYSSGSIKVLKKAVVKNVDEAKGLSKRETSAIVKDVLCHIAEELGFPTGERIKKELNMNRGPLEDLLQKVGSLPSSNLG